MRHIRKVRRPRVRRIGRPPARRGVPAAGQGVEPGPGHRRPEHEERRPRPGRRLRRLSSAGLPGREAPLPRRLSPARLYRRRVRLDPVRRDRADRRPGPRGAEDPADDHRHARRRGHLVHQRSSGQGPLRGHVRPGAHPVHRRHLPDPAEEGVPRDLGPVHGRLGDPGPCLPPSRSLRRLRRLQRRDLDRRRARRPEAGGFRPLLRPRSRVRARRGGAPDAASPGA